MQGYFIPHKVQAGDLVHLSDKDSQFIISQNSHNIEDPVEVSTLEGIYLAIITNISKASVEVEIIKKISDVKLEKEGFSITIIQALSNDVKFNFFLEKAVELGVSKIVPLEAEYSLISTKKALKKLNQWQKIIKEAKEQSRNPFDVEITQPINIRNLKEIGPGHKICLATEVKNPVSLKDYLSEKNTISNYTIAIGPERGWSVSDLEILKILNFEFIKIGNNILRTETAGLVISSILNFKSGKY